MNTIPDFHDGFFDGLWVSDEKRVHLFLRTVDKKPFTLVLRGVKLFNASNIRQGNIILDLALLDAQQLTTAHIAEIYEFEGEQQEEKIKRFLASAQEELLNALEMSTSYGAEFIALFRGAQLVANHVCSEEQ